jgi:tetratricopeptide (TPR) repeat protein
LDFVIKRLPGNLAAIAARGGIYLAANLPRLALIDLDHAIKHGFDAPGAFELRGQAFYYRHNFQRAILDFDKVIAINPKSGSAFKFRGLAKQGLGRSKEGLKDLEIARQLGVN